jgi:hypothetical protein
MSCDDAWRENSGASRSKYLPTSVYHANDNSRIEALKTEQTIGTSVEDPDSYVFGPPGSRSFYHQAKIVSKTLIPTVV